MTKQNQRIEEIYIKDLCLWTENPRDPIKTDIGDFEIIKRAIKNDGEKWNLPKLIEKMGNYYHFNKLPIVVEENDKFVVYDGNCRIALLKYLQNPEWSLEIEGTLFPKNEPKELKELIKIPCAICDKKTALEIIYRDNMSNNTWTPLIQSYFEHYLLGKEKNIFLEFEEATGLISKHDKLNQRFVKDEVITEKNLESIGFKIKNKRILFSGKEENAEKILESLIFLIEEGKINTRDDEKKGTIRVKNGSLGNVIHKLYPDIYKKIVKFDDKKSSELSQKEIEKIEKQENRIKINPKSTLRHYLIPKACRVNISEIKINNIYKELRDNLLIDDTNSSVPNAVGVLFRVFLEITLDNFWEKYVGKTFKKDDKLSGKITFVCNYLEENKKAKKEDLINIRSVATDKNNLLNIEHFHAYVHSYRTQPASNDLKLKWDNLENFFVLIFNLLVLKSKK